MDAFIYLTSFNPEHSAAGRAATVDFQAGVFQQWSEFGQESQHIEIVVVAVFGQRVVARRQRGIQML